MRPPRSFLCVSACLSMVFAAPYCRAETVVVHVVPGTGVAGLAQARDRVRELRAGGEDGAIRVEFATGVYEQTEPVVFTPQDARTTYTAAPGAKVTISGGRRITGWKAAENGVWRVQPPGEGWRFEQLWVNGRRATVARTPNQGYFNAYAAASEGSFPDMKDAQFQAFVARPADYAVVRGIPEAERPHVLLTVMQTWTVSQCRIQALNDDARAIEIAGRARYPFVRYEPDQRWFLEGYRGALDAPGEWVQTPDGTVWYKPLPGEDLTKAEVVAPMAEKLIVIAGDSGAGNGGRVKGLAFRNLTFCYTQSLYGPKGHHDGQAASGVGAAIEVDGAEDILLDDCELAHTGGYGLWFRTGCADSALRHCHLHDLGGGGVRIGDIKMPSEAELTHRVTVDDCIIQHGGRRYPSACGVFLAHAADCEVTHNDIADFYYTGISAGWVWGYGTSPSKRNRLDFNHIHHLGWGVLSDMGGFYGLGRSEGTTVNNNHVHDIASYRYGGWGLYTDEGSTGVTLENNLVHDTSEATFHQHYGKWNQVSNNIFAYGHKAQIQRSRPEPHTSFAYERNIVLYETPTLLDGSWYNWEKGTYEMRQNVYWNTAGLPVTFIDGDLESWQEKTGHDEGSVVANPLFVNEAKRDFHLKPDSPALKVGFKPFDYGLAGVRGGGAWRMLAEQEVYPDFWKRSQPWPRPPYEVDEPFEGQPVGAAPALPAQELHTQKQGGTILIASDAAAPGGHRSLKITDAPGLKPAWDPHLVLLPNYKDGIASVSFDVRAEARALFSIEWRGPGHPYLTGPALRVAEGKISDRWGKASMPMPEGGFIHVEMRAPLGEAARGQWTLKLTPPGGPEQAWELPCDEAWNELHWLGFVSAAESEVAVWIDNLKVSRGVTP